MNIELVVLAIGVPQSLRQSKWSNFIAASIVRNAGPKLSDAQHVVWFDSEKDPLPDAFLGEHRLINSHMSPHLDSTALCPIALHANANK